MNLRKFAWLTAAAGLVCVGPAAAGGVLAPDGTSVVLAHRLVLAVTPMKTTLWAQARLGGDAAEVVWIMPVGSAVEIGPSADGLMAVLDHATMRDVWPPDTCMCDELSPAPPESAPVLQPAASIVETVMLSSSDPGAFSAWASAHGYTPGSDAKALVDAWTAEGLNLLVVRQGLTPGVHATTPLRLTLPPSVPVPLRTLALGAVTPLPVTLTVLSTGPVALDGVEWSTVDAADVTWDFAASGSDYAAVRDAALADGRWLIERSEPFTLDAVATDLAELVATSPGHAGYSGDLVEAQASLDADLAALGTGASSTWVTRMVASLDADGLTGDRALVEGAEVSGILVAGDAINAPACPCDDAGSSDQDAGGTDTDVVSPDVFDGEQPDVEELDAAGDAVAPVEDVAAPLDVAPIDAPMSPDTADAAEPAPSDVSSPSPDIGADAGGSATDVALDTLGAIDAGVAATSGTGGCATGGGSSSGTVGLFALVSALASLLRPRPGRGHSL